MSDYAYGLDLGIDNTGVTIYDLIKNEFVYIGSINAKKVKKKKNLYHNALKLKYIYDALSELKEKYPPKVVAIERGFSRYNNSTQVTFRVHGITNYIFYDINQIYYPPKKVKEAILNGDATKKEVQEAIKNMYPQINFANEDESDSFAVCLTYLIKENLIEYEKPEIPRKKKKKTTRKKKSA